MKLDRNINPDGRGKYALINLRTNRVEWGGEPKDQFFVLKYKDKFCGTALFAYADAVLHEAAILRNEGDHFAATKLEEFSEDIRKEAYLCVKLAKEGKTKIPD